MADPKYAGLPGIVTDEPDVFETNDLPEVDQYVAGRATVAIEDPSDAVETLDVNAKRAFKRFEGQQLDTYGVDFRDDGAAAPGRKPTGYSSIQHGEFVSGADETLIQKYRRLQNETQDLIAALKKVKEPRELNAESDKIATQQNPSEMAQTLEALSSRLNELQVEDWLDTGVVSLTKNKGKDALKTLEAKVDGLKVAPQEKVSDQSDSGLVYELYCKADRDRMKELGRIATLEQRIKKMESLLGSDERKISYLTALTNDRTIVDAVNLLGAKVSQLDSTVLEAIDGRLTSLGKKLEVIAEKKPQTDLIEQQRQINDLYEIAMAGEKHSQQLPLIMSRLSTLSEVQQEAVEFSNCLTYLSSLQTQLLESVKNNESQLKALRESMDTNMSSITSVLKDFDKRLSALK